MAKIILTLKQYRQIIKSYPQAAGDIRDIESLLLILQDLKNSVIVTQDDTEIMRLEFDPQETNQIKEVLLSWSQFSE